MPSAENWWACSYFWLHWRNISSEGKSVEVRGTSIIGTLQGAATELQMSNVLQRSCYKDMVSGLFITQVKDSEHTALFSQSVSSQTVSPCDEQAPHCVAFSPLWRRLCCLTLGKQKDNRGTEQRTEGHWFPLDHDSPQDWIENRENRVFPS